MSPPHPGLELSWGGVTWWILVAVLLFWTVGAKQRLAAHRARIDQAFEPVHAQMNVRFEALIHWSVALLPLMNNDTLPLRGMQVALMQAKAAAEQVAVRPHGARAVIRLRQAEEALSQARQHLAAELPTALERAIPGGPGMALALIQEELVTVDASLGFARQQFNLAVAAYNEAVREFPTWVAAGLLRYRVAGAL